jgi:hypothetical protein
VIPFNDPPVDQGERGGPARQKRRNSNDFIFLWQYLSGSTKVIADVLTNKLNIERCVFE